MDTFLHPEQHVVIPEDTGRVDQVRRQLDELRVQKRRIKSLHKSRSSLLRYMRDIEPDICEVLEVQHSTQAGDLSDSDDSGSDAEAPEAHVPLASDSPQVREQLDKCSRYESEIRSMRAELDAMRVQHRQGIRHHATDSSHNEIQRMAARLHAVAHSTIIAALHTGAPTGSTSDQPVTGRTALNELLEHLAGMINEKKRSIPGLIARVLRRITETSDQMNDLEKNETDNTKREYYTRLSNFFLLIKTHLADVQLKIDNFSRLEANFAVGLMAITGIALNVKTAVRDRLRDIVKMLQQMIKTITEHAKDIWSDANEGDNESDNEAESVLPSAGWAGVIDAESENENEVQHDDSAEVDQAPDAEGEAVPTDKDVFGHMMTANPMLAMWIVDMSKFEQMLQDQSPIFAATNRVLSDLRMRYPALKHTGVTALMLMDPKRNELHACFQRLVGIDWNMSRRLSGQKVTYASDYNRMANQYRTTTFAFKKARVLEDDVFGVKLVL